MLRVLVLATLALVIPRAAPAQPVSVLHVKVSLVDADQQVRPVPRHALLISDNPASAAPRRVITALDGTVDVRLRPGNYTVESDSPIAFGGRSYQWTQTLDIAAGADTTLELTTDNAEIDPVSLATSSATTSTASAAGDHSAILMQWQDSVVALWTPTTRASGFVIDVNGLIATSQRAIGTATSVEVQLTPAVKVAGRVLLADPARDVAVIRIDPQVLASVRPVPLGCALPSKPTLGDGQMIFTIGSPLREQKGITSGTVSRAASQDMVSDFTFARGSVGGPVFAAGGAIVGLSSIAEEKDEGRRQDFRVVGIDKACEVAAAAGKTADAAAPDGAHLPVEPQRPFPGEALKAIVQRRAGSLSPYQLSSADFDIAFITPVQVYGERYQLEQANRRDRGGAARKTIAEPTLVRPLMDFRNWSDYVEDLPPVLLVRVTPKQVERFWTTVARGAAQTQGMALPPIKHFKSGFSRMRVVCDATEVAPIHPFVLEQPVPGSDTIYEGLYVFDPGALGPQCGTVKLALYSEKEPEKEDTRVVDPKVLQQIWQDFAPYREQK
jgi:Trypsin-like peptidase domain